MNLLELLNKDFHLSKDISSKVKAIDNLIHEDFDYQNTYIIENTSAHYLNEINLQNQIAASSQKPRLGFEELQKNLSTCQPEDTVYVRFIESHNWGGRIYCLKEKKLIGVFLGKKEHAKYKTPPNWDGSLDTLKKYNE
ncbi:TPA: hypothetical protein NH194_001225 [Pseudomonas aeruginosa]|nr:hypothetical protein [Pseudomonas aeruginosa]HCE9509035.1 hypothetical protein [Pseudomonas aeruginosa]